MIPRFILLILLSTAGLTTMAQSTYGLADGRNRHADCLQCAGIIERKPKEVLFGIHFQNDSVYFSMSDEGWFNTIFTRNNDGITSDIVNKEQLECDQPAIPANRLPRGILLQPVLLPELKRRMIRHSDGSIMIRLGAIPAALKNKEVEGNFVIVRSNMICYYLNFTNIDRSLWHLLDMGLFTDSLVNQEEQTAEDSDDVSKLLFYTRKVTITVPFAKGTSAFSTAAVKPLYDSLNLQGYTVKKIDIRAFSSIEGPREVNIRLQQQRINSIVKQIEIYQHRKIKTEATAGENWVEFMEDIKHSPHAALAQLSKEEIKIRLKASKLLTDSLELYLGAHRKAIITIYLDTKTFADDLDNNEIVSRFKDAVIRKDLQSAKAIQKSIFERISDNQLPASLLSELTVPEEKSFCELLLSKEVYRYLLHETLEGKAIENLKKLEKLDSANGRIKYNIYALQMRLWQYNDSLVDKTVFMQQINNLARYDISDLLIKRMMVNYYIVLSEMYMRKKDYAAKDKALAEVKQRYLDRRFNDKDLLNIGKYFCAYAQYAWADEFISYRMNRLDVDKDLLFFYLNLCIFRAKNVNEASFNQMLLNAISIDNDRFCRFFSSTDQGGISMQLLIDPFWKNKYCDNCTKGIRAYTLR